MDKKYPSIETIAIICLGLIASLVFLKGFIKESKFWLWA